MELLNKRVLTRTKFYITKTYGQILTIRFTLRIYELNLAKLKFNASKK